MNTGRKGLLGYITAVGTAATVLMGVTQWPAQANTAPNGAYWEANDYCNPNTHMFDPYLMIRPKPGLPQQWVAFRHYIRDVNTGESVLGQWKIYHADWSTRTDVGGGGQYVGRGRMRLWHQVMWWNGSSWTSNTGWVEDIYRYSYAGNWITTATCNT